MISSLFGSRSPLPLQRSDQRLDPLGLRVRAMKRPVLGSLRASLLFSLVVSPLWAAHAPVEYHVSLDNRIHHEARITVTFRDVFAGPLEVVMSRSSPGRYALHDFAKNVYDVEAEDERGRPLSVERATPHRWKVTGHRGTVVFRYTLYGDRCDGTYVAVDRTHAHFNMPATFVWAGGHEERSVRVSLEVPEGWAVATQLPRVQGSDSLLATNLQHFMDSPIEISGFDLFEWQIPAPSAANAAVVTRAGNGDSQPTTQTVRIALHHEGSEEEAAAYGRLTEAIVAEQIAIFGEPPLFDHGAYTFLADYHPWCNGDGMEHRNSTVLTSSKSLEESTVDLLGTVSHEFFHAWNIERMRPQSLEPFRFDRANMSGELWFGEGFTSYYGRLTLERAGILSLDRWAERLSETVDTLVNARGPEHRSPVEMSHQAPFVDQAAIMDVTNRLNNYLSYYSYGAALALALDLELRSRFEVALDDLMALVWRRHGRAEEPYANEDLRHLLGEVSGDSEWADSFFERFVYGQEIPDFESLLDHAGFVLRPARPEKAWLGGADLRFDGEGVVIASATLGRGPLYRAGLDRGDRILDFGGQEISTLEELDSWLAERAPGETVRLLVTQRGEERDVDLVLDRDPTLEAVPYEHLDRELPRKVLRFRAAWLHGKSDHRLTQQKHCPRCRRSYEVETEYCPWDGEALRLSLETAAEG